MNYAILGFFQNEIEGLTGANYLMISHAFVSCGLFLLWEYYIKDITLEFYYIIVV